MEYADIRLTQEFAFTRKLARLTEHEMHMHDTLEVSILLENNIRYHLAQGDYVGKPGDIFVFRPFDPHWNLAEDQERPAAWIMLLLSPAVVRHIPDGSALLAPFYTTDWRPLIPAHSAEAAAIRAAAGQAVEEEERGRPGWQSRQFACLIEILVQIARYFLALRQDARTGEDSAPGGGIVGAVERLLRQFREPVDMEDVIRASGLKKTTFYQQFVRLTALTPNDFVNRLRLQHAVHLLLHSAMPITEIAFESGYSSVSYFNRQFKAFRGVSPRQFRAEGGGGASDA
ncbi:helix-turn-helix transcriptional regulator [Paenibacillus sp. IB182496]|uniref:Helix-turn-helix transcriptional regulator n=1 Tax=Paenibacillus sabuli TaxID=2772509 RepID=A0A927BXD9_9BACL|nr:AraC family transcriptional regulator [Paenibacillus sabuli]MBD2847194.1 helix-turn-helix transcriptional regulator [Paenibacillus sabuli]